jgi:hypothetical protein
VAVPSAANRLSVARLFSSTPPSGILTRRREFDEKASLTRVGRRDARPYVANNYVKNIAASKTLKNVCCGVILCHNVTLSRSNGGGF